MYEAIVEDLSTIANVVLTDGKTLMIAEGLDMLDFFAIALILVFLTTRIAKKKQGGSLKSRRAQSTPTSNRASDRFFERKRVPALKPCPSCAEQLPLSALICDACDYNFLAARPGRGQKLLPPPESMAHEVPEQNIAAAALI
jgi:hypothetical protein